MILVAIEVERFVLTKEKDAKSVPANQIDVIELKEREMQYSEIRDYILWQLTQFLLLCVTALNKNKNPRLAYRLHEIAIDYE
jgi:hypothetical protein